MSAVSTVIWFWIPDTLTFAQCPVITTVLVIPLMLTLLPIALAACAATTPPKQSEQAAVDADPICEREARTGSMLPKTRCTTAADREAAKRDVDATNEAVRQQRSAQSKGGT